MFVKSSEQQHTRLGSVLFGFQIFYHFSAWAQIPLLFSAEVIQFPFRAQHLNILSPPNPVL